MQEIHRSSHVFHSEVNINDFLGIEAGVLSYEFLGLVVTQSHQVLEIFCLLVDCLYLFRGGWLGNFVGILVACLQLEKQFFH
jgi:hypothetical protein